MLSYLVSFLHLHAYILLLSVGELWIWGILIKIQAHAFISEFSLEMIDETYFCIVCQYGNGAKRNPTKILASKRKSLLRIKSYHKTDSARITQILVHKKIDDIVKGVIWDSTINLRQQQQLGFNFYPMQSTGSFFKIIHVSIQNININNIHSMTWFHYI